MIHKLSIDLEEWFHPYFYRNELPIEKWDKTLSRIEHQTNLLLDILNLNGTKATFFIVGWIIKNFPRLIEKIAINGHHIGSHTFYHTPIHHQTPDSFKKDLDLFNDSFFNVLNVNPDFFRAPNFSLNKKSIWALKILQEFGYKYDSSLHNPTFHPDYNYKNSLNLEEIEMYDIKEFPIPIFSIKNFNIPFSGGAYFRYYPYQITKLIINKFEKRQQSILFYIHPWEFDRNIPKVNISKISSIRMHYNIKNNIYKLEQLLNDFKFSPLLIHD